MAGNRIVLLQTFCEVYMEFSGGLHGISMSLDLELLWICSVFSQMILCS